MLGRLLAALGVIEASTIKWTDSIVARGEVSGES
jgi:hypothetical protein